jgi:hypothetical protein
MLDAIKYNHKVMQTPQAPLVDPKEASDIVAQITPAANSSGKATKQSVLDALTALSEILNLVQESTAKSQNISAQQNSSISNEITQSMKTNLNSIIDTINREQEVQSNQSFWDKLFNIVGAVIGAVLTVVGLPEIGLPLLVTSVMSATGLMQDITAGITDFLEKLGVSANVAKMVSDLIVMVTVAVVSGASSMGDFAEDASMLKKIVSTGLKTMAALGEGLTSAPSLFSDIAVVALENSNMTPEQKKKLESELQLIQTILGAALAIVGAVGSAFKSMDAVAEDSTYMAKLGRSLKNKFSGMFNRIESFADRLPGFNRFMSAFAKRRSSLMQSLVKLGLSKNQLLHLGNLTGGLVNGVASGAVKIKYSKELSNLTRDLGASEAFQQLLEGTLKQTDAAAKTSIKDFEQKLKTQSQDMLSVIGAVVTEGSAITQAYSA